MPNIKYRQNLGSMTNKAKENMTKQCTIGDKCFTSLVTIVDNSFTRHPKDLNDSLSVIIILGTNVHGGETVFLWRKKRLWKKSTCSEAFSWKVCG